MKKALSLVLTITLIILSIAICPISVSAATYSPRTTAPTSSNSYYYSSNPFYTSGYGMPNCTCYAYGRAYELLGSAPNLSRGNAGQWWWYNKNNDIYPYGSTPKLGAIACWDRYDQNRGHVAVVEAISGNSVTISESHYQKTFFDTRTITANSSNYLTSMRFLGYIYIGDWGNDNVNWEVDGRYPTPITAKPATTSGKVTVFNSSLSAYSQDTRYIDWDDTCTINAIYTNGYCNVTYPSGSSTHTEYAKTSDFIPNGVTPYAWHSDNNLNTYIRSDMGTVFGSISAVDTCTVVGKSGDKLQLIYPLDTGGYKLGWVIIIPPSDFPTPMIGYTASSENIYAHASLDSMGDTYGKIFPDDRCTLTSVNVSGGWIYVTYPLTGGGSKSGYVYLNDFIPDSSRITHFYETTVTQQTDAYRKSDMAISIGWVSVGDVITVVGKSGNKLQVLYPVDAEYGGGYKIAWIYDTYVKKNLTGISVTSQPSKTTYLEGEELNRSGLEITASYDNGSTEKVTDSCSFTGYDSTPGVKTITVSYGEKQTAFTVKVNRKSPVSLTVDSMPNKTKYFVNESIDTTGLTAKVVFNNNTSEVVSDIDVLYDDDITSSVGNKTITISYVYNDVSISTEFTITVETGQDAPTGPVDPTSPKFIVSQVKTRADSTITVDVSIENNPSITSFKYQISYPSELTLVGVEYKDLFSSRATGSNKMQSPFTMSWFSTDSENEDINGKIATMTFKVSADAADGKYPITLSYDENDVFNSAFENKHFDVVNGEVEVISSIPGDVNSDTKVNMKDIVLLQQYLNGWNVSIDASAANVNGDSNTNMKDIVLLQQYLNGWSVTL